MHDLMGTGLSRFKQRKIVFSDCFVDISVRIAILEIMMAHLSHALRRDFLGRFTKRSLP
jgi:hypothetical protein